MGLFSIFRKNKQESASDQGQFRSRSEEQSSALRGRSRAANTSGRAANGAGGSRKAAKDAGSDPLLPEKKRARRRLIGAVALALAVIIVLPMILDSEPKPVNDDIAIQIPSKDQPSGAASAPAQSAAPMAPAATAAVEPPKLASAASALDQKEEIVDPASVNATPPAAAPAPAPAAVAPKPTPAPKPEEKKPVEPKEQARKETPKKEAAKEAPKETAKPRASEPDDSARALAILEGKSASASADKKPAAAGRFVIQVAALATQEKVNELRNKLSGAGIHSFTQKIATQAGDRTRIRVGPFASRDEAEKMGARIKKLGLNATIVPA